MASFARMSAAAPHLLSVINADIEPCLFRLDSSSRDSTSLTRARSLPNVAARHFGVSHLALEGPAVAQQLRTGIMPPSQDVVHGIAGLQYQLGCGHRVA
jgi:hypothetical protein